MIEIQIRLAIEQLKLIPESCHADTIGPNVTANNVINTMIPHQKLAQLCRQIMSNCGNPSGWYWESSGKQAAINHLEQVIIHGFDDSTGDVLREETL